MAYYVYNAHGDVIQLLNASGTVTKTYDYDAYGNELSRDLNDANPFRYCGEYFDTETGFIYLRARYYDPAIGRFTSVDPAKDGLNWYAYCDNDPVNYVDYSGLSAIKWIGNLYLKARYIGILRQRDNLPLYKQNHIKSIAQEQLEYNREHKPEAHYKFDYINGQKLRDVMTYMYGSHNASYNACEAIAVYNALHYLGRDKYLEDIMYDFYTMGALETDMIHFQEWTKTGGWGTNPFAIGLLLSDYGIGYKSVGLEGMTDAGMYIMSYWSGKITRGIHTVALYYDGKVYKAYNLTGKGDQSQEFDPQMYFGENFICAYYLGLRKPSRHIVSSHHIIGEQSVWR